MTYKRTNLTTSNVMNFFKHKCFSMFLLCCLSSNTYATTDRTCALTVQRLPVQ